MLKNDSMIFLFIISCAQMKSKQKYIFPFMYENDGKIRYVRTGYEMMILMLQKHAKKQEKLETIKESEKKKK